MQKKLTYSVEPDTDFWQVTHYGFKRDNGPFYDVETKGNFEVSVKVSGNYSSFLTRPESWYELMKRTGLKPELNS